MTLLDLGLTLVLWSIVNVALYVIWPSMTLSYKEYAMLALIAGVLCVGVYTGLNAMGLIL